MALSGTTLYVSGIFSHIGGQDTTQSPGRPRHHHGDRRAQREMQSPVVRGVLSTQVGGPGSGYLMGPRRNVAILPSER